MVAVVVAVEAVVLGYCWDRRLLAICSGLVTLVLARWYQSGVASRAPGLGTRLVRGPQSLSEACPTDGCLLIFLLCSGSLLLVLLSVSLVPVQPVGGPG